MRRAHVRVIAASLFVLVAVPVVAALWRSTSSDDLASHSCVPAVSRSPDAVCAITDGSGGDGYSSVSGGLTNEAIRQQPPSSPDGLQATCESRSTLKLSWPDTGSTADREFRVWGRRSGQQWHGIESRRVKADRSTYELKVAPPRMPYEYSLTVVDRYGNESEHSPVVLAGPC